MRKRLISLLLSSALTLSLAVPALAAQPEWLVNEVNAAADFPDVDGTWCETYVDTVYRAGLMQGKAADRFDAKSHLTYAQITVVAARLYDLLTDGSGVLSSPAECEAWYQPAYDSLVKAGVLQDTKAPGYFDGLHFFDFAADQPCERRFFAELLGGVLHAAKVELPRLNQVDRIPDLYADPTGYIHDFYDYGILNGTDSYGSFRADNYLNRGQAAAMLARLIDPQQRLTFILPEFDFCRDILEIPADTVLLIVDGEELTAEQLARSLSLLGWTRLTFTDVMDQAEFAAKRTIATQRLAEELGLSPDPELIAQEEEFAEALAGYLGRTKEGLFWEAQQSLWESALSPYILQKYGDKLYTQGLQTELSAKAAALPCERTRAFEQDIDWHRAQQLSMYSPVYQG